MSNKTAVATAVAATVAGITESEVVITGISQLILHNGQTADPRNEFAKQMKVISGKRGKTDADFEALSDLEIRAGVYTNSKGEVIVPGRVLESHIADAAKKSKEGKLALSGMYVMTDGALTYPGGPLTVDELVASDEHRLTVGVKVGTSKVMRSRPVFPQWSLAFTVHTVNNVVNASQLRRWLVDGGALVGLGDWRPRNGRYIVTSFTSRSLDAERKAA